MKIRLEEGHFGWDYLLVAEDGRSILVQTDYDYPSIASIFGWQPKCGCRNTDGTNSCKHYTAAEHIANAQQFLDEHIGDEAEDPGYFD